MFESSLMFIVVIPLILISFGYMLGINSNRIKIIKEKKRGLK